MEIERLPFSHDTLLSARHTRLITIFPSRLDTAEIRIELHQASIDAPPQYEALSYTWGGQTPTKPVICNDRLLLITENALSSIRRLRCHFEPRKLWIDAICINQALAMEKATQVTMMAEIYRKAHRVIIWLGEDQQIARALRYCRLVNLMDKINFDESKRTRREYFDRLMFKATPAVYLRSLHRGLTRLCHHAYWSRIWTLQEVGVNTSCYVYAWPGPLLALSIVWRAVTFLDSFDRDTYLPAPTTQNEAQDYGDALTAHWQAQRPSTWYRGIELLSTNLLDAMAHKMATEPRDHVFALKDLYSEILGHILVDYSIDISALFCEAAAALINRSATLSGVLHYATCAVVPKRQDLPSWVPDWTVQESFSPWPWSFAVWDTLPTPDNYRPSRARVSPDHRRLTIVAAPLGIVGTLSQPLPSITADTDDMLWLESLAERFRSWLAACEQDEINNANKRLYELFNLVMLPLRPGRKMPTKLWFCQNAAPVEPYAIPQGVKNQRASLESWEILRLKSKMPTARLFVTAGNNMGICKDAQQGDVVALLSMGHGAVAMEEPWSEAWILRHAGTSGCYRVVGPAIVTGGLQPNDESRRRLIGLQHLGDSESIDLV